MKWDEMRWDRIINVFIILCQDLIMFISKKKTIKQQIEKFKKSFFQSPNLPFHNFLVDDDIADIIEHTSHKRTAVFTPLITLKAFIFQALGDDGSCKQAVASVLADQVCDGKSANSPIDFQKLNFHNPVRICPFNKIKWSYQWQC